MIKIPFILMVVAWLAVGPCGYGQPSPSYDTLLAMLRRDQYDVAFKQITRYEATRTSEIPDKQYIQFLLQVASIVNEKGNYEMGLDYSSKALSLARTQETYVVEETEAMLEIAYVYYYLGQYTLSLDYIRQAQSLADMHDLQVQKASALNTLGMLQQKQGAFDNAMQQYELALKMRIALGDIHGQSATLGNIGLMMEEKNQFERAMVYQQRALFLDDSIHDALGTAWSQQIVGALAIKMGRLEEARAFLDNAERHAKRLRSGELLVRIYKSKKDLFAQQGDYGAALEMANQYQVLHDSIYNRKLINRVSLLQNAHELDLKTREIAAQRVTLEQQRNFIIVITLIAVLVAVLAFFYYRSFHKINALHTDIAERNEEIQMQSEELTEANAVLTNLNTEIEDQKKEIEAQAEELLQSNQTIHNINLALEQTIKKRTEELLEAYMELDTFFYRASHDFRRPLTTFMGLAEVAKITVKDPYVLELFAKVKQTAVNLDKMLMKLQSISNLGLQQLSMKDVFVNDIFSMLNIHFQDDLERGKIALHTRSDVSSFVSYPSLVNVIVENLVENSIHFRRPDFPYVRIEVTHRNHETVIDVTDNGQGIHEQYQHRIFEMYFRSNENAKGNGLGLYIVKKAVEKLNGRVSFSSRHGEGSTFSVILPDPG